MRTLLVLILSLSIPLQGFANVFAFKETCPMEQSMKMAQTGTGHVGHDCCNDADTFTKTGKLCKTGQTCPGASVFIVTMPLASSLPAPHSLYISSTELFALSFDSFSVWRPPALI